VAPIFRSAAAPGGREKVTRPPHTDKQAEDHTLVVVQNTKALWMGEREYTLFYINNESPSLPVTTELARNVVVASAAAVDRY
jgi:hypothetical protein